MDKKRFGKNFAILGTIATLAAAAQGCGKGDSKPGPVLSPGVLRDLQNKAGCLDVVKLSERISKGEKLKLTMTDAQLIPDSEPVSELSLQSFSNTEVTLLDPTSVALVQSQVKLQQNDCQSFSIRFLEEDGSPSDLTWEPKFDRATPTELSWEEEHTDSKTGKKLKLPVSLKLLGDNTLFFSGFRGLTVASHHCASQKSEEEKKAPSLADEVAQKIGQWESHWYTAALVIQWGKPTTFMLPSISDTVKDLQRRSAAFKDPAQAAHLEELEKQYCDLITKK